MPFPLVASCIKNHHSTASCSIHACNLSQLSGFITPTIALCSTTLGKCHGRLSFLSLLRHLQPSGFNLMAAGWGKPILDRFSRTSGSWMVDASP